MPASAAVAIWCDVAPGIRDEFDDWHTREHMPERLALPGLLRGSRWVSADGGSGYFMLYEARNEAAITTGPYLDRLNDPTPWSRKMMPHHRNMVRSLCRVEASSGAGIGQALLTVRFSPGEEDVTKLLAGVASRKGMVAGRLLRNIARPDAPQTTEQRIRGGDTAADWILLINGYSAEAVASFAARELTAVRGAVAGLYRLAYVLTKEA
jgi:hypothetical protein